jgi:hypothetical protein
MWSDFQVSAGITATVQGDASRHAKEDELPYHDEC